MSEAKKTPLYERHVALGAKMVDFHGWIMPVQYSGIIEEAKATRSGAGIFDASHMGEVLVEGPAALTYLQKMLTNDLSRLKENEVIYSPMCYPDGGTVDDVLVYCLHSGKYMVVVNAGNADKDREWFAEHAGPGVTLTDVSEDTAMLPVQGPTAARIIGDLAGEEALRLRYYRFQLAVKLDGVECLLSRTGYTGEDGFEIFCPADKAASLWDLLLEKGQQAGLLPAGLGARDILRLEAALPLYGQELSAEITPLEAGLHRFVALEKKEPFIGQEALRRQKAAGVPRSLRGLVMLDKGVPRTGYTVRRQGKEIGRVSSGSYSPALDAFVAMAFIDSGAGPVEAGEQVEVLIRDRAVQARVTALPFYRRPRA